MRKSLYLAAIKCKHNLSADKIILYADPKIKGSALSQLGDRLIKASLTLQNPVALFFNTSEIGNEPNYEQVTKIFRKSPDAFPLYAAPHDYELLKIRLAEIEMQLEQSMKRQEMLMRNNSRLEGERDHNQYRIDILMRNTVKMK